MARTGVTREQVFETAEALALEGQNPTVMTVRAKLGGGSPNTITPFLAEWKAINETKRTEAMPPLPAPVETVMRQVWGVAWKEAQGQLETEREALAKLRDDMEKERGQMLAEISRLDRELEEAREAIQRSAEHLEGERRAHDQTRAAVREAQAIAAEREKRITAQDEEIKAVRRQTEAISAKNGRLEADLDHGQRDMETARKEARQYREAQATLAKELESERQAHTKTQEGIAALRVEVATQTERAAHVDELRALVRDLREQLAQGGKP